MHVLSSCFQLIPACVVCAQSEVALPVVIYCPTGLLLVVLMLLLLVVASLVQWVVQGSATMPDVLTWHQQQLVIHHVRSHPDRVLVCCPAYNTEGHVGVLVQQPIAIKP